MNRKVLGGVIALVIVVVGVWFLWFRGGGDDNAERDHSSGDRTGKVAFDPKQPDRDAGGPRRIKPLWSLDVDPEGPLRLEGQVLGPDDKPVGGAEVWLASVPPRKTTSEDDGSFVFDKLVGRKYTLSASSGDLVGELIDYKLTAHSDPAVLRLGEGARVVVTVVDDGRKPVAGADVQAAAMAHRSAKTDANGEATLRPVSPGWVAVQATATGYAPRTAYATVGSAGGVGRVTVVLHRGFAVTGRVVDERDAPVAKARVYASGGTWGNRGRDDDDDSGHEIITDARGEFTFPALANGQHTLSAVDGEHAPAQATVSVEDRPPAPVVLVMKQGGVIAGKVVDIDKQPVAFASVRVGGSGDRMWRVAARQATTDRDGTFELRGLARDKLAARAEAAETASGIVEVDLQATAEKRGLELVLDVDGKIAGIVVDDAGNPVPEVQVHAFPDIMGGASTEGVALAGMSSTSSAGDGTFTIHGLPDGAYRLWAARTNANAQWGRQGVQAKTGDTGVRLTLAAGGNLTGKIVIAGVDRAPKFAYVRVGYEAPTQVESADGAFAIKDLTAGKYTVAFHGPEFAELIKHDIEIVAGKTTDLGTVTVMRGRRLAGKVVDGSGAPVAGAKIKVAEMLFSAQGQEDQAEQFEEISGVRFATSDASGEFAMIGVPAKRTYAMADHPSGRSIATLVPEGGDDPPPITLTLRGFGTVVGRVMYKGQPQSGVDVGESTKGGGAQATFAKTDDSGTFTLQKVTEGTHVLHAMQSKMMSMRSTTATVTVTAGQTSRVTIDIPVGQIALAVSIKPLQNAKLDAAQVFLFAGSVTAANAKQLTDSFFQGGIQGMKFWFGPLMPPPEFDELVPGDYSVCSVPITGSLADPTFQQKLQANMQSLKVYCKGVRVLPSPVKQSVTQELPAMDPLPASPPS